MNSSSFLRICLLTALFLTCTLTNTLAQPPSSVPEIDDATRLKALWDGIDPEAYIVMRDADELMKKMREKAAIYKIPEKEGPVRAKIREKIEEYFYEIAEDYNPAVKAIKKMVIDYAMEKTRSWMDWGLRYEVGRVYTDYEKQLAKTGDSQKAWDNVISHRKSWLKEMSTNPSIHKQVTTIVENEKILFQLMKKTHETYHPDVYRQENYLEKWRKAELERQEAEKNLTLAGRLPMEKGGEREELKLIERYRKDEDFRKQIEGEKVSRRSAAIKDLEAAGKPTDDYTVRRYLTSATFRGQIAWKIKGVLWVSVTDGRTRAAIEGAEAIVDVGTTALRKKTGSDGTARFTNLPGNSYLYVSAAHSDYITPKSPQEFHTAQVGLEHAVNVVLAPKGPVVRVKVINEKGQDVLHSMVRADAGPYQPAPRGSCEFTGLTQGKWYAFTARATGRDEVTLQHLVQPGGIAANTVTIKLNPGRTLKVSARDASTDALLPVPCRITLTCGTMRMRGPGPEYLFAQIPEGECTATVSLARGYRDAISNTIVFTDAFGDQFARVSLEPATASLEVSVAVRARKPEEGMAPVSISVLGPREFTGEGRSVAFSGLPAGSYLVQASAEGAKTVSELVTISPDADGQRYRIPLMLHFKPQPLGNFGGAWDTTWGIMRLTQSGNSVSGTYEYSNGKIRGKVEGRILKGSWTQDEGAAAEPTGSIEFTLSSDGNSWSGIWDYRSAEGSGDWYGTRAN